MYLASRGLLRSLLSVCFGLLLLLLPGGAYQGISDETIQRLPRPNGDFDIHAGAILSPILQTRVPGTRGSTAVLNHFANFFRTTLPNWTIQFQNSTSKTPVSGNKEVPFVNLIASRDPPWAPIGEVGRLTIAAHYDSKYEPEGFIGAIDSAAPCAMILHAMRSIDSALTKKWDAMLEEGRTDGLLEEHKGIQVLLLDGEEAFKHWTATDSLYGARSLAKQWDSEVNPVMSTYKTPLSSISLFVLLDLLGSRDPTIQSYFPTTHWAYQKLGALEKRFRDLKQFKSSATSPWFIDSSKNEHQLNTFTSIQDDHIPFLVRGVEVLHVIDASPSTGLPDVWHTLNDDGEHLDADTIQDWSVLVAAFAAEWMELEGYIEVPDGKRMPRVHNAQNREAKQTRRWDKKTEL